MFKLVRYFSITSLTAFIVAAVLLGVFYRQTSINNMIAVREAGNAEVTQLFVNAVWEDYADFYLNTAPELSTQELLVHPTTAEFREIVLDRMNGLQIVKVKVFGLDGRTLFSTEEAQIGEDRSSNAGFLSARDGVVISEMSYRDQFSAFEGVIEDRNMISSYVPLIPDASTGEITGVLEVYEDVTPLLARINRTQTVLIVGVVVALAVLYGALLFIVNRAERIMREQQAARDQAQEALRRSEARLADLVKNAPVILWTIQPDLTIANMEGRPLTQRRIDPTNFVGHPFTDVAPNLTDLMQKVTAGEEAQTRLYIKDGIFDTRLAPMRDDAGNVVSVIAVSNDITDLLEAEEQLVEAQDRLKARNVQLERAMEFTRMTLESIREAVQRGAEKTELSTYLGEADAQFQRLN